MKVAKEKNRSVWLVVAGGILAVFCLLAWPFLRSEPPQNRMPLQDMGAGAMPIALPDVGSDIGPIDGGSARVDATNMSKAMSTAGQGIVDPVVEMESSEVWAIVEQLEELAQSPRGFHRAALPLLRELGTLCLKSKEATLQSGASIHSELLERVVQDELRSPLVRGAVFLGMASQLSTETFRMVFDPWLRDRLLSPELLRAAALAASERGSKPSCSAPINLELLQKLPVNSATPLPSVYPIFLTKVLGQHETIVIREVLLHLDPLLNQVEIDQVLPALPADVAEAADLIIAREVLISVLGHGSIEDSELQNYILSRAQFNGRASVDIRAAYFVINSLSNCSEDYLDFVGESSRSSHPLVAGLSHMMRGSSVGPLNLENLSLLHSMRWSNDVSKNATFMLELTRIGKRLQLHEEMDEPYRREFSGFLRELVNDELEAEQVRMASISSLRTSGDWDTTIRAATDVFRIQSSGNLQGLALVALVSAGQSDKSLRPRVIDALSSIKESTTEPWILADIETFISELNAD